MGLLNDDGTYNIDPTGGGGDSQPGVNSTLGTSAILTPDAFNQIITDTSSFSITIDSGSRNAIQWIAAKDRILIGTTGGEWRLSGHSNKPMTPTNYDIKLQTVWGSKDMQPLVLHEAVLFVDFVGKKLREMIWNGTEERYLSPDILLLAEHITKSGGITTMAYQRNPDSIIWATLANGDLISCTYVREQDVIAWAVHPISLGDVVGDEIPSETEYEPTVSTDYPLLRTTTDQDDPQLPHVTAVNNLEDLEAVRNDLAGNYYLTADIDASATAVNDWAGRGTDGWNPIGNTATGDPFTGTFDGCGYTISNLYINKTSPTFYYALFGEISDGAKIANVTLSDVDITGQYGTAALVSQAKANTTDGILIQNCHSSGNIKTNHVTPLYHGGLIGRTDGDATDKVVKIYDCSSSAAVDNVTGGIATQGTAFGGLIGYIVDNTTISNCFATGNITSIDAGNAFGGLIGEIDGLCYIDYCYATGDVQGEDNVGGFLGHGSTVTAGAYIRKCYATGNVTSDTTTSNTSYGGFAGYIYNLDIDDCYARGNVTMTGTANGVAGFFAGGPAIPGITVDNCYSTGLVTATGSNIGGFNGDLAGFTTNSYWDTETSEQATSADGTGHTTTWLKTKSNYPSSWDFDDVWRMAGATPWVTVTNSNNMGVNSVCVIPGTTEDEVWVTVSRAINGNLVRYVERMKPRYWGTDQEDCFFVDSGLTYDSTATTTFSGLDHLEGETVAILGDGAVFATQTVTNGSVTLPESVSVCHIGLPFTYTLKPMRFDQNVNGTSKGSIKKATRMVISFLRTLNARYGDGTTTRGIDFRTTEAYTTPPALFTGDKVVILDVGYSVDDPAEITGSDPLPATIRCLIPHNEVTGD